MNPLQPFIYYGNELFLKDNIQYSPEYRVAIIVYKLLLVLMLG